jgi:hypothetical protein
MLGEALGCLDGAGIERKRGSSSTAVMATTTDDDVVCACGKEKMETLYSPGAWTSIPCLHRDEQAPRTGGVRMGTAAKATGAAPIGGPAPVLSAWCTRTGAMAGVRDRGTLPTPSRSPHGA